VWPHRLSSLTSISRVWDLSQSIDRYTDTTAFGVANCITPKGMPFVTYRGGPVIGLEQLALQGLPIDSLILTRHPHKEQQDMAGNAMTSTVVACAILSALIEFPAVILDSTKDNKMISPRKPKTGIGEFNLEHLQKQTNMELETAEHVHPKDVSQAAGLSVSLCSCEGPCNITKNPIYVCQKCGHLCCESCLGIPGHEYTFIDQNHLGRIEPWVFYEMIKKALPMRVTLSNLFYEDLEVMAKAAGPALDLKDWELYTMALKPALGEELYFQTVKRSHCWVVVYDGQKSRLELKLQYGELEWSLFGKPHPKEREQQDPRVVQKARGTNAPNKRRCPSRPVEVLSPDDDKVYNYH